ncbi:MAG: hypothetical protein NTW29_01040 [Bacteroidetes bacterium]|nr:hypothetical protein [Bacteroidota bacterium]
MKKNSLLLAIFQFFFFCMALAQQDAKLKTLLNGKNRLEDIMPVIERYYSDPATISDLGQQDAARQLKHWKRWEWYMSSRLGKNGEFVNINQKLIAATGSGPRQLAQSGNERGIESVAGAWSLIGPLNTENGIGRVDRLAFHPSNASIVYAGAAGGGLWRTTDAGLNWSNLTADLPCLGISGIGLDPNDANTIFILTGDGDSDISGLVSDFGYMRFSIGVLRSTDGGVRWTRLAPFPGVTNTVIGYRLVMHPTNSNIFFACTSQGLFRTDNGGASWTAVQTSGGRFYNMKFKPGNTLTCYAISYDGFTARFYKSTDGGIVWNPNPVINTQINSPTSRVELAVAETNSSVVYLLCGGVPANGQFKGLYRSDDSGNSFVLQSSTPNILGRANDGSDNANQSFYDLAVTTSNTTSATVVTGGIDVWRSLNSGVTWAYRGDLHDDVHDLGFHPVDNKLWAATDGGVYSSTDNGATWTSHFTDMSISQFYRMAVSPADYLDIIAGAQDNGIKKRTNGTSFFDEIAGADGYTVGYDDANSSTYYAIRNNTLTRFTNDGANNSSWATNLRFFTSMAVHTSLGNTVFLASDTFRTVSNGNITNYVAASMPRGGWYLKTCPSNGNRIYMAGGTCPTPTAGNPLPGCYQATTGVLRRSDDGGATWPTGNILSSDTGFPIAFPKITSIGVDPTNSLRVWVTFGGFGNGPKVYYSDYNANPNGQWVDMSGTLPDVPVNCIAIDNNNNAYIGTDNGVYYRGTGMNDWVPFYNNLPYVPVTDLVISEADSRIRASTFGRGIWSSDLYSPCVANLNITGTLEGQEFYEASNNITATATLLTTDGSKVQMRGGNEVLLQDGFSARETTQFRAAIGPCGSGGVAGFRMSMADTTVLLPARQYLPPSGGKKCLLHIRSIDPSGAHYMIDQQEAGETTILLTNVSGEILRRENRMVATTSKWEDYLVIGSLQPGVYYLNVALNGRVEHRQELIIQ